MNSHYHSSYHTSNQHPSYQSIDFAKQVTENMQGKYSRLKTRVILFALCIPLCMILFMCGGVLTGVTGNFAFIALTVIGFFCFPVSGIAVGITTAKAAAAKRTLGIIDEIYAKDCTYIKDLSLASHIGENKTLVLVKRLIETKNVEFYEVVGDIAVAKTELRLKVSDLIKKADSTSISTINVIANKPSRCLSCGSAITDNSKFCSYCGSRL